MRILHYSLGFPPYRTGGLTSFCMGLCETQIKNGDEVGIIWPGEIKILNKDIKIKINKNIDGIQNFEIVNPLPVSLDEGVQDVSLFIAEKCKDVFISFLKMCHPDIVHIHTLMGLPLSFVISCKELGIRTVFTSHDFYPICSKMLMFRDGNVCQNARNCEYCYSCNSNAIDVKKIILIQSSFYRVIKNNRIIKILRKKHKDHYHNDNNLNTELRKDSAKAEDYLTLRQYYSRYFDLIDKVHFNSKLTKDVYLSYFKITDYTVIPITHNYIADNKKIKKFSNHINFSYLGRQGVSKGYFLLKNVFDEVYKKNKNFSLNLYFTPDYLEPYMKIHDAYNQSELSKVFDDADVLISPSVGYDTFGFTVLEALSFGVPVIVSTHTGAKDLVSSDFGYVFSNSNELKTIIDEIKPSDLIRINNEIYKHMKVITSTDFYTEIKEKVYKKT